MIADAFNALSPPPIPFDPARAQRTFETLGDAVSGIPAAARAVFASAFGNSPFLCRLAIREGAALEALWRDGPAHVFEDAVAAAAHVEHAQDSASAMSILRRAKRRAALAIALADIAGLWDLDAVTRALTRFSDTSVTAALRFLLREAAQAAGLPERDPASLEAQTGLVILAMGKAGGFELNYSSDIDLIAFYEPERFPFRKKGDARGAAVDLVKGLVRLLGEITAEGYVFRVDLRLRPDAGATQIAISTEAAERYYEGMGQNWERAAFIKARPCAGDRASAERFLKKLEPFVWRRNLDYAAIEDIHSIKRQIQAHGRHGPIAAGGHNIKLGRGGIREIEFFAQTQQLILGGRDRSLRSPRTLDAIEALCARGLVCAEVAADLSQSYRFLRRIEHRLQMVDDEQTHTLPNTEEGISHIACFAGFAQVEEFRAALVENLRRVELHCAGLFERAPPLGGASGSLVFTGVEDDPETLDTLRKMGFRDPHHLAGAIRGWHHGRIRATRSSRARELLTRLIPALLASLAATADPDAAFAQFDRFVSRIPAGVQLFSMLIANPHLLELIASIVGSAPRLADHLARTPAMLDAVLDRDFLAGALPQAALQYLLRELLAASPDHESALNAVRRFAKEQSFRVGVQLINGRIGGQEAGAAFANIAECAVESLLERVRDELAGSAGAVEGGAFCVVAMGKLGGREMTASSDLDLIFVYDVPATVEQSNGPKPLPVMVYYARLAQRLIAALTASTAEGGLYEVDMRLRPSGNKGPAAVSLESFRRYHAGDAWTWERLALTRARVIVGPPELRAATETVMRTALTRRAEAWMLARDVREMRDKLAAHAPGASRWDLKFAPGGLVDIEFVAQFLQLLHAGDHPCVLDSNTLAALERLSTAKLLGPDHAAMLIDAARLQLELIQILRISVDGVFDPQVASVGMKALLARAGRAENFSTLQHRLALAQDRTRAVFDKMLAI